MQVRRGSTLRSRALCSFSCWDGAEIAASTSPVVVPGHFRRAGTALGGWQRPCWVSDGGLLGAWAEPSALWAQAGCRLLLARPGVTVTSSNRCVRRPVRQGRPALRTQSTNSDVAAQGADVPQHASPARDRSGGTIPHRANLRRPQRFTREDAPHPWPHRAVRLLRRSDTRRERGGPRQHGGRGAGLRLSGGPMPAEPREGSDTVVFDDMRELPDLLTGR